MDESPKPIRRKENMHATMDKINDILQHCGSNHTFNYLFVEANPTPTEGICQHFNELRSDLLLLHELRTAMSSCEFELQSLRHQYEACNPGKTLVIPPVLCSSTADPSTSNFDTSNPQTKETPPAPANKIEIIDVVGSPQSLTL